MLKVGKGDIVANDCLSQARTAKKDEFYTQWIDIEREVQAYLDFNPNVFRGKTILLPCDDPEWSNFTRFFAKNFNEFGLKKLISTSYAIESKKYQTVYEPTLFEQTDPRFDIDKTKTHGKIFVLNENMNHEREIDIDNLQWDYLEGNGDFRSEEVRKLRDDADIIITNPPFSLFRQFLAWIMEEQKQFLILGSMNVIVFKEVFSLIKENKIWLGSSISSGDRKFYVPEGTPLNGATCGQDSDGRLFINVKGVRWFTNLANGRKREPLKLMTMAENLKYSKHKEIRGKQSYDHYDNYDAIEVPFTDAIPSDYDGVIGVPISFLDKYCPEQFEIIDALNRYSLLDVQGTNKIVQEQKSHTCNINGKSTYFRIVIKHKRVE
jgi:hypothetical protein